MPKRGFTLVEMLVVVAMLLVLLAVFVPYVLAARESGNRTACANNLRQVFAALTAYGFDNNRSYPRVRYDAAGNPNGWTAFTGPDCDDPFLDDAAVKPNDVTASLWLLVRTQNLETSAFVCPSTSDRRDLLTDDRGQRVEAEKRGNFRSPMNLSYSYAQPYSAALGYRINDTRMSYFVVMSDRNPGRAGGQDVTAAQENDDSVRIGRGNSLNHGRAGQNVLYVSGTVQFVRTPFAGVGRDIPFKQTGDNIFTALRKTPLEAGDKPPANGAGVIGQDIGPAWSDDSYLVPFER